VTQAEPTTAKSLGRARQPSQTAEIGGSHGSQYTIGSAVTTAQKTATIVRSTRESRPRRLTRRTERQPDQHHGQVRPPWPKGERDTSNFTAATIRDRRSKGRQRTTASAGETERQEECVTDIDREKALPVAPGPVQAATSPPRIRNYTRHTRLRRARMYKRTVASCKKVAGDPAASEYSLPWASTGVIFTASAIATRCQDGASALDQAGR